MKSYIIFLIILFVSCKEPVNKIKTFTGTSKMQVTQLGLLNEPYGVIYEVTIDTTKYIVVTYRNSVAITKK